MLEDKDIVGLYWQRNEKAIAETAKKYGSMLQRLSESVLHSREDAEECVNDSYVSAWNSMPENRPCYLGAYMAKIARNHSLNRLEKRKAQKRQADVSDADYDELSECIPDSDNPDSWQDSEAISKVLNDFVASLPEKGRVLFVRRYFYSDPEEELAKLFGMSAGNVRITLYRLRQELKKRLTEAGLE